MILKRILHKEHQKSDQGPKVTLPDGPLPLVSCICPTYNRPPASQHLIEEAIESFLRQDYPNKELIVLNDCPDQELVCDAPGVIVVNAPARFPTLGDKANATVELTHGELISPWDDDDISLPWRLSLSVAMIGSADYFNPRNYWFWSRNGLQHAHSLGYAHNASVYSRKAFDQVGGHPPVSLGIDRDLQDAFKKNLENIVDLRQKDMPKLTKREWFYIYRWGVSATHVSAKSDTDGSRRYQEIGELPVESGRFELNPQWQRDYVAVTRTALKELRE